MKRYIVRYVLIAKLAALALLTFCFVQPPIGARATEASAGLMPSPAATPPASQRYVDVPPVGFVFGQTLRLSVAHVGTDTEQNQTPPNVRVGVWLLDASGRTIAQSAEVPISRHEFRSINFDRAPLHLVGEPGTGRLQVRARLVMNVAAPYQFTDNPQAAQGLLVPSLEIVNNSTGQTAALQEQQQRYNRMLTLLTQ